MPLVPHHIVSASAQNPELASAQWRKNLSSQGRKGFDGFLIEGFLWASGDELARMEQAVQVANSFGLTPILALELDHFRFDHPLVIETPEFFTVRHRSEGSQPVDPRAPQPASGEARVRLGRVTNGDRVFTEIADRLREMARIGFGGFRLNSAGLQNASWLGDLRAELRLSQPELFFLAGPRARFACDRFIVSLGEWDGRAAWLAEEIDELNCTAPALCEIGDAGLLSVRTQLAAAHMLGSGVIIPLELAGEADLPINRVEAQQLGTLRQVSSPGATVTAILRAESELRESNQASLILLNTAVEAQPVPTVSELSSSAAAFDFAEGARDMLEPGEVRMLAGQRANPVLVRGAAPNRPVANAPRLVIEDIAPVVDGGNYPVKRVVGDSVAVEATLFADGHEQLAAELRWRALDERKWRSAQMKELGNDRWGAVFPVSRLGRYEFLVEGWLDLFGGFRRDFRKKLDADVAMEVDHAEGRELVEHAIGRTKGKVRDALKKKLSALENASEEVSAELLLAEDLARLMDEADERRHRLCSVPQLVDAERIEARFSSWYELFPRSMAPVPESGAAARHGTFADVIDHLPRIRAMGFDTLYFPPIHPIGQSNRKGPNNTLTPGPDDPGSPYAIGGEGGGHDALHPELGTLSDFARLVSAARDFGIEIALDFAIQASPDHPWLKEHPGWFAWRPDGSMKYAENPPKKYQDIVNVDFYADDAVPGLWEALRDVILTWIDRGVKTFRVDNPHTKPLPFWEWMIADVRARHPEAIFLSEAFTRPTMMYRLAKIGFSQSYTYFTWRDTKHELAEYITELNTQAPKEFYRPHFFVNTPDINPFFLQTGGRPAHRIRAVLAATLSGLWGVYSGFELCDARPLGPGKEEYQDSEKYEVRPREWRTPGDIVDDITLLNRLRKAHPALQTHLNTQFYVAHDDATIWYGKPAPGSHDRPAEMIMVMVNMDPHNPRECDFEVPLWEFGLPDHGAVAVEDLAGGHRFDWHGKIQHIRLTPDDPYRIWRIVPHGDAA